MLGRDPGTLGLVGVDDRVVVVRAGVDDDDRKPVGQEDLRLVELVRLDQDDDAVDRLLPEPGERAGHLALVGVEQRASGVIAYPAAVAAWPTALRVRVLPKLDSSKTITPMLRN